MESRNHILSELQSVSPVVAQIAPANPYYIPENYFEGFAAKMLQLVKEEETLSIIAQASENPYQAPENYFEAFPAMMLQLVKAEETSSLLPDASQNPYQVPENYFADLPNQLLARIKDQEIPAVLHNGKTMPYTIPQGYFESLPDTILKLVNAQESVSASEELEILSPLLSSIDKKSPYQAPAGYFDDLINHLVSGGQAIEFVNGELENLSPLMMSLKTKNVYEVPPQYFEKFATNVIALVIKQEPAKVVSMSFGKKLTRYAAAAIVAGILVLAGLLYFNKPATNGNNGSLAQSDDQLEIETKKKVEGLTDDELVNYLDNLPSILSDIELMVSSSDLNSEDVKIMLADIPDEELKRYLLENSDATIASSN